MPNLMTRGMTFLRDRLGPTAGETLTYSRPSTAQSVVLTDVAWVGRPEFFTERMGPVNPVRGDTSEVDVLIPVASLILGAVPVTPAAGDTITLASGVVLKVLRRESEPEFRYSDNGRTIYRVHAKVV